MQWAHQNQSSFDAGWRILTSNEGTVVGVVQLDILSELQFTRMHVCLEVRDEPCWTETTRPGSISGTPPDAKEAWEELYIVTGPAL
jgi:hypothetical protein